MKGIEMLHGHDIVCFANDWDSDPLSKKHVMSRLAAAGNRVLWVNSLGVRNPTVSTRDLNRMASKVAAFCRGPRRRRERLWVTTPLVIPFHGSDAARRVNRRWLTATLGATCRRLGMSQPITWTYLPSSADVVGHLGEKLVVYQCVDEYAEFTGADRRAILGMDEALATRADVVLVSAQRLHDLKNRFNPATYLVTHGVEVAHFRRALDAATAVPEELAGRPGPVIGFFGLLADWVDLELVRELAVAHPTSTVALVGKVDTDVSALDGLGNVLLLGRKPYGELPGYCKGFDVAILPFRVNELTLAANPLKLREYLAAGLPVVSTAIPEAERLSPLVRVGRDPAGFLRLVADALAGPRGPQAGISAAMDEESWDRKVEEMGCIVSLHLSRERDPLRDVVGWRR